MGEVADQSERRSGLAHADPSFRHYTQRDRDRVLYSEAFRRLGGVTQVVTGQPTLSLHNRLTHSLKVEQVAVALARKLTHDSPELAGHIDLGAIQTACLAHDLGHPPFGHAGEVALHEYLTCEKHRENPRQIDRRREDPCHDCKLEDGFEGNAQTFRILTALSAHRSRDDVEKSFGLDLSRASLAAATKYPWLRGGNPDKVRKWGAYDCDSEALLWAIGNSSGSPTLNAQIMDWADDIAYAVHDIEDFYRVGIVPIDDYKPATTRLEDFLRYVESDEVLGKQSDDVRDALSELTVFLPNSRYEARTEDLIALDLMRGRLITQFVNGASFDSATKKIVIDPLVKSLNAILKQFVWYHVIDAPELGSIQHGQQRLLQELCEILIVSARRAYNTGTDAEPSEKDLRRLPHGLTFAVEIIRSQEYPLALEARLTRAVVDYVASLDDLQAYNLHAVLHGRTDGPPLLLRSK